jgi:hypothetical protein
MYSEDQLSESESFNLASGHVHQNIGNILSAYLTLLSQRHRLLCNVEFEDENDGYGRRLILLAMKYVEGLM